MALAPVQGSAVARQDLALAEPRRALYVVGKPGGECLLNFLLYGGKGKVACSRSGCHQTPGHLEPEEWAGVAAAKMGSFPSPPCKAESRCGSSPT